MPIYEFRCRHCGRPSSIFTRNIGASHDARCPHCGSCRLERAVSRFAYHKSEPDVLRDYGPEPKRLEDWEDPRQIGRWTESRLRELGLETPQEARQIIDAAREGELPEPAKEL